jgi:DNA polymerase-3 subunit gamma/tau
MDLHLKYRPTKFNEVVGQEAVVSSLSKVLRKNSNHSFIFHGPSGVGKTTLARIIARKLGCTKQNLYEYDGATHSGVDSMRDITANLIYRGLGDPIKVVIVDEAHAISKTSWQSALKAVEEPPPHAYWCFCTTEPGKIPKTIKTRCIEYRLTLVAKEELYSLLERVTKKEKIDIDDEILELISRRSEGSPRQALVYLAQVRYCTDKKQALSLMQTVEGEEGDVADLCRQIAGNPDWEKIQYYLCALNGQNPEGIRIVITNWLSKIILNSREENACRMMERLEAFKEPYPPSHNLYPLILSIAEVLYANED